MLDSEQIHNELKRLGYDIEPGKKHPSYAYEHYLGNDIYLYVKRRNGASVNKEPLVFPPIAGELKAQVHNLKGLHLSATPTMSSSYRRLPRLEGRSQHGYSADVESLRVLVEVARIFGRPEAVVSSFHSEAFLNKQEYLMKFPLNQILFGPPGTGKTYHTTDLAVQISDPAWYAENEVEQYSEEFRRALKTKFDELAKAERIKFTTFHQSFAYEDFIEGIRAVSDSETGDLRYPIEDGVFKTLCKNADKKVIAHQTISPKSLADRAIWKMSLGNTQTAEAGEVFTECLENSYALLGWGGDADFSGCDDYGSVKARYLERYPAEKQEYAFQCVNVFRNEVRKGDLIVISDGNSRFRAIAEVTGQHRKLGNEPDWFHQARDVKWLQVYEKSRPVSEMYSSQFMQKTLYKLNPSKLNIPRLLEMVSTESPEEEAPPHVLIIDEINRGNIARIFGELITLLEPSKRAGAEDQQSVTLPYSKETFSVPSNVYVIGTMNTADKSLAQLDLALRRRFNFIEMRPDPSLLSGISVYDIPLETLLDVINQRIEVLLDADHQIGHAYFIGLADVKSELERQIALKSILREKVIPLLQEYFFEDYERIGWVLNDPVKSPEHQFITSGTASANVSTRRLSELFQGEIAEQLVDNRFRINENAFDEAAAYQLIVGLDR